MIVLAAIQAVQTSSLSCIGPLNSSNTAEPAQFVYVNLVDGSSSERNMMPKPRNAIRFVLISDTHTRENTLPIPDGDVLIHAGDVLFHNGDRKKSASIQQFNDWATAQRPPIRILIGGNHDQTLEDMGREKAKQAFSAGQYLQDESLLLSGIRIYGSPFSIPYWGKPTHSDAFNNAKLLAGIPDDIDILVTHGAPKGFFDVIELKKNGWLPMGYSPGLYNVGSPDLAERVRQVRPKVHVFGHVHKPLPRVVKQDGTIYINACSVQELDPLNGDLLVPIVFDMIPDHALKGSNGSSSIL